MYSEDVTVVMGLLGFKQEGGLRISISRRKFKRFNRDPKLGEVYSVAVFESPIKELRIATSEGTCVLPDITNYSLVEIKNDIEHIFTTKREKLLKKIDKITGE